MKVLVIPDVHLKPQMFRQAAAIMNTRAADRAVCLMDIPDDWDREYDIALYEETYDEAIRFAARFWGGNDLLFRRIRSRYKIRLPFQCTRCGSGIDRPHNSHRRAAYTPA
mgnify:CR=1 FL=1